MFRLPKDGTLRLAVILDEAHRLAKDVTLPKLMKEGRKYGIPVVVASAYVATPDHVQARKVYMHE
jgi:DNA phosphorothioation-dependent restriction protein DptH